MDSPELRDRLLAVMAADACGYSRLISLDARATVAALDLARAAFREQIAVHGGRVIDMAGDSVLAVFETTAGAMKAALGVQGRLAELAAALPEERRLLFRIGIHVGDVMVKEDGSVYGDGVNVAARLEALAMPGGVAVSQAVRGMVAGRVEVVFEDLGERTVKNIAQPVHVHRVRPRPLPGVSAAADDPALRPDAAAPGRLARPVPGGGAGGLFGRERLLAELHALAARDDVRLLTLTGPGGSGKTRLALHAAAELAPRMADGARVVLLAPVRDARHLPAAIAAALGLQEGGAESLDALVRGYLRLRQTLLVLDNMEHLPQAVTQVAALLEACPRLKVLATSRVLLHLREEHELKVPPLALPAAEEAADLAASPAVALFAAHAAALGRDVLASADDLRAAAQICRRMDGLPLAIELAAARLRVLTPAALAARLQQSLPILKAGATDAPSRQRTLRDTIAWSHDLLDAPARVLFRRLGVFAGGWSLEGAEALADDGDAVDGLDLLIDHNLVQRIADVAGQSRYAMLETIREYALEQLTAAGEVSLARDRHAAFFIECAATGTPHLASAGRLPWLLRLRAEMNNFRLALSWLLRDRRDVAGGLALAAGLTWLWYFDGLYREGRAWMAEAMELPGADAATAEAASALSGMARLTGFVGDMEQAHRLGSDAIARWRALGDRRGLGFALFYQGIPALIRVSSDEAAAVLRESRQCFADLDDDWGVALATVYEGVVRAFFPGEDDAALALLREGLARCEALGDEWAASTCSAYIGTVAMRRGDHATARRCFDHILGQARETADRFRIARSTHLIAELDLIEGRHAEALSSLTESLQLTQEQGRIGEIPQLLRSLGRALSGLGRPAEAASMLAAGARTGLPKSTLPPDYPAAVASATAACRQALGDAAFDRAWQQGSVLPLERAVQQAQAWARSGVVRPERA